MTDQELADRIVALGVGIKSMTCVVEGDPSVYLLNKQTPIGFADKFTHSWEVAGALMEKCSKEQLAELFTFLMARNKPISANAINLACVEVQEAT